MIRGALGAAEPPHCLQAPGQTEGDEGDALAGEQEDPLLLLKELVAKWGGPVLQLQVRRQP